MNEITIQTKKRNIIFIIFIVFIATLYFGTWVGYYLFLPGSFYNDFHSNSTTVIQTLARTWDSGWYGGIAEQGYSYNGNNSLQQNIAFFPLYPLIIKIFSFFFGFNSGISNVAPAFLIGLVSIYLFYKLASHKLNDNSALVSTTIYSLYPGASYFISGYPTSTMNFLVIFSLLAFEKKWYAKSAIAAGLATAAGPLTVFLSFSLFVSRCKSLFLDKNNNLFHKFIQAITFGLISLSGIIVFIIYQKIEFGYPFAFIGDQKAWGYVPLYQRIINMIKFYPILGGHYKSLLESILFLNSPKENGNISVAIYYGLNFLTIILSFFSTFILIKNKEWLYSLYSALIIVGYMWFIGSVQGPIDAYRILYIDIPIFISFGLWCQNKKFSFTIVAIFAISWFSLFLQTALFISSHWVI